MIKKKLIDKKIKLKYAHLNLDLDQINFNKLRNPLKDYHRIDDYLTFLKIIRDPKNFYFTLKYIFNIEPSIFQLLILEMMWIYSFPMIIAARGASKSFLYGLYCLLRALITQGCRILIVSASFRQSKNVFEYAETILNRAPILKDLIGFNDKYIWHGNDQYKMQIGDSVILAVPLGDTGETIRGYRANYILVDEMGCISSKSLVETDLGLIRIEDCWKSDIQINNLKGQYEFPEHFIITPLQDVYEIKTERGFSFRCSDKHKVLTKSGFKLGKNLTIEDELIFENKYKFPQKITELDGIKVDEDLAWLMGIWIAEGSIKSRHTLNINMTDEECMNRISNTISKVNPELNICHYRRESYIDNRFKKECKVSYQINICNIKYREKLNKLGLERDLSYNKKIPWSILQSPRNIIIKFLSGLFEGDGSAFLFKSETRDNNLGVSFYTSSKQLAQEVLILLNKLDFKAFLNERKSKLSNYKQYYIRICNGRHAIKFVQEMNIPKWNNLLNICYYPPEKKKPPIFWDKARKKYVLRPNNKFLGRYETYEEALSNYKEIDNNFLKVKSVIKLDKQERLYDFYLPQTHSFYGNGFIQHNSVPEEIYEVVIRGFGAVSQSPSENVIKESQIELLKSWGQWDDKHQKMLIASERPNQIILTGTGDWGFKHFAKYWKKWKTIINSRGDINFLINAGIEIEDGFDWRDYCVMRLPLDLIPKGFMDKKSMAQAKASIQTSRYLLEYGSCFCDDSDGFFKRSLIEKCTCKEPIYLPSGSIQFSSRLHGDPKGKYFYGVDPASESDNFAIVIIEQHSDHNRIVYCWTTTRQKIVDARQKGQVARDDNDFYQYIAQKIRSLIRVFPPTIISLDSQGGGYGVMEALHNFKSLKEGELPIWPLTEDHPLSYKGGKDYGYDDEAGIHNLEMVQLTRAEYRVESNHSLKSQLEQKTLLFPFFDPIEISIAQDKDESAGRTYDTLQDVVLEIEQLKEELSTIVHTTTLTGLDRWDTPEILLPGQKKGRLRKDRYSALLFANYAAVRFNKPTTVRYEAVGGIAQTMDLTKKVEGNPYGGSADWYSSAAKNSILFSNSNEINIPKKLIWGGGDDSMYREDRRVR